MDKTAQFYIANCKKNNFELNYHSSNTDDNISDLSGVYSQNIKNNNQNIIFVGYFQSAIIETITLNVKNNLTDLQLDNLIAFELQKHVPINVDLLKIIYYYSKNNDDLKMVINLFCCLKTEWGKFEEYCTENNLKFDYIFFCDNENNEIAVEKQINGILHKCLVDCPDNNMASSLPNNLKIHRHKKAKQTFIILLALVVMINGYFFFSEWRQKQQEYTEHIQLYNKLKSKLKKAQDYNKNNKKLFANTEKIAHYQAGIQRVDFLLNYLHKKLPKKSVISSFNLTNKTLKLTIITSQNESQLMKRLKLAKIINVEDMDSKKTRDNKNQYSLDLTVYDYYFSGGL